MSRAFSMLDVIKWSIHRPPYALGWLREDDAYARFPGITPEFVTQAYCSGRVLAMRERPVDVVWLRPHDDDWPSLEKAAKAGAITL